jgi:SanA protein
MAAARAKKKSLLRRIISALFWGATLVVLACVGVNVYVPLSQQHRIYTEVDEVPIHDFAIVLGTSKLVGGYANRHFTFRMEAAAALYREGKVKRLLLSGDGHEAHYNEPEDMREALGKLGVPPSVCLLDTQGLRSDMTISRAKKEYGIDKAVLVSDDFHLPRCLMLAKHYGLEADAFYIKALPWQSSAKSRVREWFARIRMFGDFYQEPNA